MLDGDQLFMSCLWSTPLGAVELLALNDTFGTTFSQVVIADADGAVVGLAVPDFGNEGYAATYEMFDPITRITLGSATANASLAPSGDRINDHEWVDGIRFSVVGQRLTVDGTLAVTLDGAETLLSMDNATCEATDLRVRVIEKIAGT